MSFPWKSRCTTNATQPFFNYFEAERAFAETHEIGLIGSTPVVRSDAGWTLLREADLKRWIRRYLDGLGQADLWKPGLGADLIDFMTAGAKVLPVNTPFKNP